MRKRLTVEDGISQAQMAGRFEMLSEAKAEIETFGPNPAVLGQETSAKSGRAIALLQQAAAPAKLDAVPIEVLHREAVVDPTVGAPDAGEQALDLVRRDAHALLEGLGVADASEFALADQIVIGVMLVGEESRLRNPLRERNQKRGDRFALTLTPRLK